MKTAKGYLTKLDYQLAHRAVPFACVDILIVTHEDEVALLPRDHRPGKGELWTPGGRIRKGELLNDACVRIWADETRIPSSYVSLFDWRKPVGIYQYLVEDSIVKGSPTHSLSIVINAHTGPGLRKDAKGFRSPLKFFKYSEAIEVTAPPVKSLLACRLHGVEANVFTRDEIRKG